MFDEQRLINDIVEIVREKAISEEEVVRIDKTLARELIDRGYDVLYNVRINDVVINIIVRLEDEFFPIECCKVTSGNSLTRVKNLWDTINRYRDITSGFAMLLGEQQEFMQVNEHMQPKRLNDQYYYWGGKIVQRQDEPINEKIKSQWIEKRVQIIIAG